MSRHVPPKIQATALTTQPPDVQIQHEKDALFFVEHPSKIVFVRPYCIGEAEEYALPAVATMVRVTRTERTFLVYGITTLVIEDALVKKSKAKQPRRHLVFDMTRVRHDPPDTVPEVDRVARAKAEHERQAKRRMEKQAQRAAICATKRGT